MKDLSKQLLKPLVDFPEDVQVTVHEEDSRVTYQLSVNKNDIGKVIGKAGARCKSDYELLFTQQQAHHNIKKIFLEIGESIKHRLKGK